MQHVWHQQLLHTLWLARSSLRRVYVHLDLLALRVCHVCLTLSGGRVTKENTCVSCVTVTLCGCRITKDDYPAQAGSYATWVPPVSYAKMWSLIRSHGLSSRANSTCNPARDFYDAIKCLPSTVKAPQDTMPAHCREQGITSCPEVLQTTHSSCIPLMSWFAGWPAGV